MKIATYEATVENGQSKLTEAVNLLEHAKVFVMVTGVLEERRFHVGSPRLTRPEPAGDFRKEVSEEPKDAGLDSLSPRSELLAREIVIN